MPTTVALAAEPVKRMLDSAPETEAAGSTDVGVTRQRTVRWALVAVWAAAIFAVSSLPGSTLPPTGYGTLAHFVEYAVLAGLLYFALRTDRPARVAAVAAITLASLYGVSDEIHQAFVPLRVPDASDWAVDTLGALTGTVSALAFERLHPVRARRNDQ